MENIETKRFKLRLVNDKDNLDIFNILKQDEVITNLNLKKPNFISDVNELINEYSIGYENNTKEAFAIIDKVGKNFLGVFLIKLDLYNESSFEYTVYIGKENWNKGVCSEVMPFMIKEVFEKFNCNYFRAYIMEKNKASAVVCCKNGFELEKVFEVPGIDGKIYSYLIKH